MEIKMARHEGAVYTCLIFLTCTGLSRGYPDHRMESRYEGDGWFSYSLTIPPHPVAALDAGASFGTPFQEFLSYGATPTNWSPGAFPGEVGWSQSSALFPASLVTYTFSARSTHTHWRTASNALVYTFRYKAGPPPIGVWVQAVGHLDVLVPCTEALADGSESNIVSTLHIWPDIGIDQAVVAGGEPSGFVFSGLPDSETPWSAMLQVSDDLVLGTWSNITGLANDDFSHTVWTSSVPLVEYGRFFRVIATTPSQADSVTKGQLPAR